MPFPLSSGHKALRSGRLSIPGRVYLLTTVTRGRQRLFVDPACVREASRVIDAAPTWGNAQLLAWVLMPDHWHGALLLGKEPLGRVMNRFKANVSRALRDAGICQSPPWARGFHDHALRKQEDLKATSEYIIANPLRAGLVDNVLDYPYWNAAWLPTLSEPARGRCS
ncbi:MAG: transposase [Rhodanobacter sp.]